MGRDPARRQRQPGHVLKLELLAQDSAYLRTPTGQQSVTVSDLRLRLPVVDPGRLMNGTLALPEPLRIELAPPTWTGPVANAISTITFRQHIGAGDPLRTGVYARTLTSTLSTTNP